MVETAGDARAAALDTPVVVIAVLHNTGTSPEVFTIHADGQPVCDVQVPAGATARADCVISSGWTTGPAHTLSVTGATSSWSLDFLEIATHHGSSSRLVSFLVLPDVTSAWQRPGSAAGVTVGILLWVLLAFVPAPVWPPRVAWVYRGLAAAALVMLAAMLVSAWVSPFLLVMPVDSFVKVAILLLAPRLWRIGAVVTVYLGWLLRHQPLWRSGVAVTVVALVVASGYGMVMRYSAREFDGNYTGLLRISEEGFDRSPLLAGRADVRRTLVLLPNEGYDGQFMYFAAFDPLLRRFRDEPGRYRAVVDAPPYRFGRIGFPWLVRAVAGARWDWYPAVMMGLVLMGVAASAAGVARLAQLSGMSALWGGLVLAVPGFWQSARVLLPEPVAAAALLLGYLCVVQRRIRLAAVLLAASLLVRETGVVCVAALVAFAPRVVLAGRDRWWLAAAAVPLVAWRLYVAAGLWPDWGWNAIFYNPRNVSLPLAGIASLWAAVSAGLYHPHVPELARAAIWFPVILGLAGAVTAGLWRQIPRALGVALLLYLTMALAFTFPKVWGHIGNVQRASYEAFVMLMLVTVSASGLSRLQRGALIGCWGVSAVFVLYGAHDGLAIREALFPWG